MKWKSLLSLPKQYFDNREKRDGPNFHMTVVPKLKMEALSSESGKSREVLTEEIFEAVKIVNLDAFVDVGVGKCSDETGNTCWFVIVSFEKLRTAIKPFLSADDCNFHITLAFNPSDVHGIPKSLNSLMVDPLNQNLIPGKVLLEELKSLIRTSGYSEVLKIIECVKKANLNVELMEIKALTLFKLARYEECLEVTTEILSTPGITMKHRVLALIRQADVLTVSRKFRAALLPIWTALNYIFNGEDLELKKMAENHLFSLLQKCARNGYLRIDTLPVDRKQFQETAESNVQIGDEYILKCFDLWRGFDKKVYRTILDQITSQYGEIENEVTFDEDFMPLESRWVATSPEGKLSILQRNFSYLWPNVLAVSSTPRHGEDISVMADLGINLVITLTEEEPLKSEWFKEGKCRNLFIPVPNYNPPSVSAADRIVWEVAKHIKTSGKVLIHCGGGKGRAGTAAAVILMTLGMDPNSVNLCESCLTEFKPFGMCLEEYCRFSNSPLLDPISCLRIIRLHRPESLETAQQEAFLKKYSNTLWQRSTVPGAKDSFIKEELNEDTLEIFGVLPAKLPRVIVLSGLPGSGKTTFGKKLAAKLIDSGVEVDHINQDAIGGREAFENALGIASKNQKSLLIIDRCNARKKDRKLVLDLLHNPSKDQVTFVHFATNEDLCLQRIEQRFDHLTLKPEEGRRAVKHFSEILEIPDQLDEGVATVLIVKSIADSERAVELFSKFKSTKFSAGKAEKLDNFYKFPRTEHLFDLGGATRDDLVLAPDEFKAFFAPAPGKVITMEEKIDGANVGFSMDENGKILCQNRSHYVDSKHHPQFQSLGSFIYQKRESLERILQNGHILYGEWMYAKHSIHYNSLPDIFVAFDLFDPKEAKFYDRATFNAIMSTTNIAYVKPLTDNPESFNTREALETLLKTTKSKFSDSLIEGIYFRWDQNGRLKTRAKLVRSDFIAGNDHWSKGKIIQNKIEQ